MLNRNFFAKYHKNVPKLYLYQNNEQKNCEKHRTNFHCYSTGNADSKLSKFKNNYMPLATRVCMQGIDLYF